MGAGRECKEDTSTADSDNANPAARIRKCDIFLNAFKFSKSKSKKAKNEGSNQLPDSRSASQRSSRFPFPPLNASRVLEGIFTENLPTPTIKTELPLLQQRIERTDQLVYCNTLLLQDSSSSPIAESGSEAAKVPFDVLKGPPLDNVELDWLDKTKKDPMEVDRLRWLTIRMVDQFVADVNKNSNKVAEIVALGPFLQKEPFRKLLSTFFNEVRLEGTHRQSAEHSYHLTLAVSRILDVMADHKVQNVDRVLEHEPLSTILSGLFLRLACMLGS
ncbi:hypothetical protein BGZ96_002441 [Linnemannia gamsii]|uniref:Arm-like repeat domain-containing protein n=1 Tax=Linnemannia gamsii TaxID=64522 RepID=A0ABQ7JKK9_9FUNG|nr:hypothetical protein BGZ96_002441 [Linnemannia gamsii]